jgi:hypothetical protein
MSSELGGLGWPEAELFDLSLEGGTLSFGMSDLLAYGDPARYEVVRVSVSDIEALRIEMWPFSAGAYGSVFVPVDLGAPTDNDEVIEGVIRENPFSDVGAEYFWLCSTLRARSIETERTGKIVLVPRGGSR